MKSYILESVRKEMSPIVIDELSNYLGETRNTTRNALTAVIPLILAHLANLSKSDKGLDKLYREAKDNQLEVFFAKKDFSEVFLKNRDSLLEKGGELTIKFFEEKSEEVYHQIAKYANIQRESSQGIISSILPLSLNVIREIIEKDKLTASSLKEYLEKDKEEFFEAIPSGISELSETLSLKDFSRDKSVEIREIRENKWQEKEQIKEEKNKRKQVKLNRKGKLRLFFLILLLMLILIFSVYLFLMR